MSGQQVANIEPSGEITKQQSSHSESSQSYAIPGGEAHEQSRDASRLMEANIPGGQMKQQTQEHQFAKQAEAVQETPGGVQRTSETAASQQQVSQAVSSSQTQGADGSISTRRVTSKRTVQQSSSVKQSHISSQTSAHPAQGMIQAPVPSELQIQNLATQQNNQRQQMVHQQQQLAQQQQLPDLPADSDMTSVSRTKHTQHSHKKVTQTSQKVVSATQQQQQQQQLGTPARRSATRPSGPKDHACLHRPSFPEFVVWYCKRFLHAGVLKRVESLKWQEIFLLAKHLLQKLSISACIMSSVFS